MTDDDEVNLVRFGTSSDLPRCPAFNNLSCHLKSERPSQTQIVIEPFLNPPVAD